LRTESPKTELALWEPRHYDSNSNLQFRFNQGGGVIEVDMAQLFGAMVLWMSVITALVCIIVWLLCVNRHHLVQQVTTPQKSRDITDVNSTIESAQSLVEKTMGMIEERDRELERLKSQNNTPIRSPSYNRDYSRTTTYDYRRDEDEEETRRREQERRKDEEDYRRRQERIEELRRERRSTTREEFDDARTRKASPREIRETSNYGQSPTKKQNFQRNEYSNRVTLYQ